MTVRAEHYIEAETVPTYIESVHYIEAETVPTCIESVGNISVMHVVAFCWFMALVVPQSIPPAVDFSTKATPPLGCLTTRTQKQ